MNKIITYMYLFAILIICSSCSKDEIKTENTIQGTWKLTAWNVKTPIDLNNNGVSDTTFMPGCLNGSELKFLDASNGTLFFNSTVSYNTSNEEGTLFFMTSCSTDSEKLPDPFTYTEIDGTIILTSENQTYILTLNGNTISMLVPNGFIATDIETFETTVLQDINFVFTKQ